MAAILSKAVVVTRVRGHFYETNPARPWVRRSSGAGICRDGVRINCDLDDIDGWKTVRNSPRMTPFLVGGLGGHFCETNPARGAFDTRMGGHFCETNPARGAFDTRLGEHFCETNPARGAFDTRWMLDASRLAVP